MSHRYQWTQDSTLASRIISANAIFLEEDPPKIQTEVLNMRKANAACGRSSTAIGELTGVPRS